jgi:hypothetical protein
MGDWVEGRSCGPTCPTCYMDANSMIDPIIGESSEGWRTQRILAVATGGSSGQGAATSSR